MNAVQLRELINDVLKVLGLHSADAVELLMLTAAQESHLGEYIKQLGGGPARGIFQMEPATERDIWINYLLYKSDLEDKVKQFDSYGNVSGYFAVMDSNFPEIETEYLNSAANIPYQIAMARVHYLRDPKPIPSAGSLKALATYYKRVWNTELGKATIQEAMDNYVRYVL